MADKETEPVRQRPFLLSIFCVSLFVYTGTLSLVFLLSVVFNNWVSHTVDDFFQERTVNSGLILLLSLAGLLLNGLSFFAVFSIWNMRKYGLYLLAGSSLLFLMLPFFLGFGNTNSILIMGAVNIILFLYYRRLK
jgi:hypothetical protein